MTDAPVEPAPATRSELRIVEMFGPTVQGEGPTVGRPAHFLRLAGCNLTCGWCDTAFSWDPHRQDPQRPVRAIATSKVTSTLDPRIADQNAEMPTVRRLVITGGEPLLQAAQLVDIVRHLGILGWAVEVETSGTISPGPLAGLVHQFNVSPKLSNSGVAERARVRLQILEEFARLRQTSFKFVVEELADLDEVADLLGLVSAPVKPERVFIMAQGTTSASHLRLSKEIVDAVVDRGWSLTPRWHTLLWDDERGR
jgi:7-carboxy-7-deazaguanine synthase